MFVPLLITLSLLLTLDACANAPLKSNPLQPSGVPTAPNLEFTTPRPPLKPTVAPTPTSSAPRIDLPFEVVERGDGNHPGLEQYDGRELTSVRIQQPSDVDDLVTLVTPKAKAFLRGMDYERHFAIVFFHGRRFEGDAAVKVTKVTRVEDEVTFVLDYFELQTSSPRVAQSSSPYEVVKVEKNDSWPARLALNYHVDRVHKLSVAAEMPPPIYAVELPPNIETITEPKGVDLAFYVIERRHVAFLGEWLYESLDPDLFVINHRDDIEKVEKYITRVGISELIATIDDETFFGLLVFQGKKDVTSYGLEVEQIVQEGATVNVFAKFTAAKPLHARSGMVNSPSLVLRVRKNGATPNIEKLNLIVDTMVVAKLTHQLP